MRRLDIYYLFLSILLASCCYTSDSTLKTNYPFTGDELELKFKEYYLNGNPPTGFDRHKLEQGLQDTFVTDSVECSKYFKKYDSTFISNIDFKNYDLTFVSAKVVQVFECKYQIRVLINHKDKKYTIEMRAYTKTCNSGLNSNYNDYPFKEFLLIPKVPKGYTFKYLIFYPAVKII